MAGLDPDEEAPIGSLDPSIHRDLILARRYIEARNRAFSTLLGDTVRRNPLRLEIVRSVLIEFGFGRHSPMGFYQRECREMASSFTVRDEIYKLIGLRLLVIRRQTEDRRVTLVVPTIRLVSGVSRIVPMLVSRIEHLFISRAAARE